MRIVVIGGTRFIGPCVVRRLFAEGHEVTLFHRGKSMAKLPESITHILGNRRNLKDFRRAFKALKPDVVLDMVPITEQDAQQVVETFKGITSRVVALSSQDVYRAYGLLIGIEHGELEKIPLTEDSNLRTRLYPYRGDNPRAEDDPRRILDDYEKILAEMVYMSAPELPGTILRLPMVYGPGDYQHRLHEYLKRMDDRRPAVLLEEGLANWQWTRGYVENVADAIVLAIQNDAAMKKIYNVGKEEVLTTYEWVSLIAKYAEWDGEIIIVPKEKLPKEMVPDMRSEQHLVSDTTRIRKELGYREMIPDGKGMRRTIAWERENPPKKTSPEEFNYEVEDRVIERLTKEVKDDS
jgi:nucleoside-diphosphate-sugar epimerase